MKTRPKSQNQVLVCGLAPASQLTSRLPLLGGGISVHSAHTPDDLRAALTQGRHPVCIMEHQVPGADPSEQIARLMKQADDDPEDENAIAVLAAKITFKASGLTAYDLLPDLVKLSPGTKFIITTHQRGFGISPRDRALYKERPEVVKIMGGVGEWSNTKYLLNFLSQTYLGQTWKPNRTS